MKHCGNRRFSLWTFASAGILVLCTLLPALPGAARAQGVQEIRVSGSSEIFTVLQEAIDAAAAGDTLFVGPGRFDQGFSPREGWMSALGYVDKRPLTIIGAGMDETILGPVEYTDQVDGYHSRAIVLDRSVSGRFTISDMTVAGVHFGVSPDDSTTIERVRFENCGNAGVIFDSHTTSDVRISDCQFRGRVEEGYVTAHGVASFVGRLVQNTRVERCHFGPKVHLGFNMGTVDGLEIVDCEFGLTSWLLFSRMLSATLRGCRPDYDLVPGGAFYVDAGNSLETARLTMVDCDMGDMRERATVQLWLLGLTLDATRCRFGGGRERTIWTVNSNARVHSSFIRASAGPGSAVYTELEAANGHYLDFRYNHWWTTEADAIQAWIYDGADPRDKPFHPEDRVVVEYEPFLLAPVDTQKQSVGSLKARFREQE